ncbi:transcriptional regulator [Streptomyces coerulescens]|uniref:Transcriptional regulator n=1 Tax=Streptomyces coerulescens TaxID=29304 RepID=A0ABW0CQJ6_STRCD
MTENPLVSLIARGETDRTTTLAALALEQSRVIPADRRAFLHLAQRSASAAPFFTLLAEGEALAGERLGAFAAACGVTEEQAAGHEPLPGCQAYPAFVAWLALNAAPAEAVFALTANFSTWGGYCATIAEALRRHYGFTDEACAFFDFFAEPSPELDRQARAALEASELDEARAHRYARLLQSYENQFWSTLHAATP